MLLGFFLSPVMQLLTAEFGPVATRSYLLLDPTCRQAAWIDPARGSAQWAKSHLKGDYELRAIWLTHSHWDHIADIGQPPSSFETPIWIHPLDRANLEHPGSDLLPWPAQIPLPKVDSTQICEWKQQWQLGQYRFELIHTPGHSPGSCCLLCSELGWLFSGDTLFASGFGRVDFPTSSPQAMRQSLTHLSQLEPQLQLFPGHGPSCKLSDLTWLTRPISRE